MFVVAVSNHKGGVGKTTTALSVAAALAQRGRRVLAVDLDPQGNLGLGAGLERDRAWPTVAEVLKGKARLSKAARKVPHPGLELLRVVPADVRLAALEGWLYTRVGYDTLLGEAVRAAGRACDFVVLDCPPSLGSLTLSALTAADVVLAPVQCEFFSLRGLGSLQEMVELVRGQRNPGLQFRVVPTLYDQRNRICKQVLAEVREGFGAAVSEVVVGVDTRVREAQAKGLPVSLYAPSSRATLAYEALALEVAVLEARGALARTAA